MWNFRFDEHSKNASLLNFNVSGSQIQISCFSLYSYHNRSDFHGVSPLKNPTRTTVIWAVNLQLTILYDIQKEPLQQR